MSTHIMKPGFISELATYCGLPLNGKRKPKKTDYLGTEDGLPHVDCAGCLRGLIASMRIKQLGLEDNAHTRWLCGGDTGMSSATIWCVMMGVRPEAVNRRASTPKDPSDFGRCHDLLKLFPEWRTRLHEVAARYPEWTDLVEAWSELTALYTEELPTGRCSKLYDRMHAIEGVR